MSFARGHHIDRSIWPFQTFEYPRYADTNLYGFLSPCGGLQLPFIRCYLVLDLCIVHILVVAYAAITWDSSFVVSHFPLLYRDVLYSESC